MINKGPVKCVFEQLHQYWHVSVLFFTFLCKISVVPFLMFLLLAGKHIILGLLLLKIQLYLNFSGFCLRMLFANLAPFITLALVHPAKKSSVS